MAKTDWGAKTHHSDKRGQSGEDTGFLHYAGAGVREDQGGVSEGGVGVADGETQLLALQGIGSDGTTSFIDQAILTYAFIY